MVATSTTTTHKQCEEQPTPTTTTPITQTRRSYCYYDTTATVSSPLPLASTLQQHKFNSHPGHQSGGCQVLLSSNINNSNSNNGRALRVGQQQRRISLTTASILRTKQTNIPQRHQSSTDLDNELHKSRLLAFGGAVRAKRRSSSSRALYHMRNSTSTTAGVELRKWYQNDSSSALVAKPNRRNSFFHGLEVRASASQCPASSTKTSSRRRRSLMHVGGAGTETRSVSDRKNMHNRGMGRRRSLNENFVCFTESVFKTLEERRNTLSNVMSTTFRKNSSAVKVSPIVFLQLMNNQDWLCLQEQYLDTEGGSMVLLELVMMDHSKFQELLVLAAGQPYMDVAGKIKSSAPTLLHVACGHKAPWALVHRILSLDPCSVYDLNTHTRQNVLHVAVQKGCIWQVLDLLIHLAPELASKKDVQGRLPLHYLCMPLRITKQEPTRGSILSNIHNSSENDNGTRLPRKFNSATDRMLTLKMVKQFCHAHPKAITAEDHHTGMSPLMCAVTHGAHADIIDYMIKLRQGEV
jgi:hypothetical protein